MTWLAQAGRRSRTAPLNEKLARAMSRFCRGLSGFRRSIKPRRRVYGGSDRPPIARPARVRDTRLVGLSQSHPSGTAPPR
jgi:hypothetical protein